MGPRHDLSFCAGTTSCLASELLLSMGPSLHLWFLDTQQQLLGQNNKSLWVPALTCGFCMQYSAFWTRITSLYGSQTSPVVLCMQYSVISTGMTSLYGFQPSSEVFASNTATFGPELQVSMGPRSHLSFFLHSIQRDFRRNDKSICVPALICHFCMQNSEFWTRMSSLYGYQT